MVRADGSSGNNRSNARGNPRAGGVLWDEYIIGFAY